MTLRLASLGSPCTETALLGVSAQVSPAERPVLVRNLLVGFEEAARELRCGLLGMKDVAHSDQALWVVAAAALGYRAIPSLPIAHLDVDFATLDDYLARLSAGARRDMRRKLRALASVRIEIREEIGDVIDQVMALYAETRSRAELSLEALTRDYFLGVMRGMAGRALMVLYFQGDDLLGANLLLQDGETLLDKYFCMDAARGRPLNLYFLSWFTNVRLCLERGWTRYQSGQAAYDAKLRLGSRLTRTTNCFRHRNRLVNGVLQLAAPLFAADPTLKAAA
jgi:predicted N-acyltransferase